MVKHIVLYKLKDSGRAGELVDRFLSMRGRIEGLLDIKSGSDVLQSSRSFDVALICDFLDLDGLNAYQEHPIHLKVREFVKQLVDTAHSVDYIY